MIYETENSQLPIVTSGNRANLSLSSKQRLDWLQLIRSENVGPATFRDLINHFGTAGAALDAIPELSQRAGKKKLKICPRERANAELEAAYRLGIQYIGMGERDYPQYLTAIDYPPPLLCVRGNLNLNQKTPIGMVGARNSSLSGLKLAAMFATELGAKSHYLVSGFARGIDAAAHKATLKTGSIAVMAGGVDVIFPPEHDKFYYEMLEEGNAFVSEMPFGYRPRATDFPRRNRIIAGISLAVVVIEAAKRSGSLITARLANEAGRLVFGVPGSPLDPRSAGANSLLKNGALIATEATDIIEQISPLLHKNHQQDLFNPKTNGLKDSTNSRDDSLHTDNSPTDDSPTDNSQDGASGIGNKQVGERVLTDTLPGHRQIILEALGPTPIEIDDLVRHCQLPVSHVQLVLIELSLAGNLERHPGNCVSLIMNG